MTDCLATINSHIHKTKSARNALLYLVLTWFISIDLKKAFDRVEYRTLFAALEEQGVESSYIQLLQRLYANQRGKLVTLRSQFAAEFGKEIF